MIILPAIDLIEGRCVRLAQGDFDRETRYSDDPAAALRQFAEGGAVEAHLVDLDGAKAREPRQHDLFVELAADAALKLQVAGGFRTSDQVARVLDAGVLRVVIGSLAIDNSDLFASLLDSFGPDRLTLALDVHIVDGTPMVATHGWKTGSGEALSTVLGRFPTVRHLLVTDIARDGMLSGPNLALMQSILAQFPGIELQASGGVASLDDLDELRDAGASRAIVGKAIWERRFTVAEGVAHARG
ncbi:1-(5-phosphoribosyl)-5-[(5-phosphoribosylamino)methylideneamino] imidazole-4-carboxamide isomerase [Sphingomonas sp. LY29]|uniref:1-(5-phosphoribosyl)-5-[(5- phosphoribosylamino)methylideneamino] imidazole-4-carboxamide isomerase n=1 Tax=Sphingomonas sp. LY29 TaxID=3095341 RepID=UPI002D77DCFC|nr:1-(5-phosphoribosyl)-5-[(5-phosphoribosylamino)methylideneamino] imidazole-4-carboxamide isomerase [Sphingomonas sp. LY29]WRP26293.1 1-(5-phosphoribosyl)-5-[(5-phosphoribosylamino)methylideneamino] imidazole-4-carboxamide isomerase [Sphingomonas sp. LY29]